MNRTAATILCCVLSFAAGAGLVWSQQNGDSATDESKTTGNAVAKSATPGDSTSVVASPSATSVTRREPQFENEQVKSWKSIIMPSQPLSLHRHDEGRVLIALSGGPLDVVDKDGKVLKSYNWERGKAYWLEADPPGQMHADVNNTGVPIEVIVVQLLKKN